jgi:hypothetical protein
MASPLCLRSVARAAAGAAREGALEPPAGLRPGSLLEVGA